MSSFHLGRDEAILSLINAAADKGAPCPTNEAIAEAIGAPDAYVISSALARFRDIGLIALVSRGGYRYITVAATGKSTDWTTRPRRYVKRAERTADRGTRPEGVFRGDLPVDRYIDRNPCGFCGVRADIGCRHNRRLAA